MSLFKIEIMQIVNNILFLNFLPNSFSFTAFFPDKSIERLHNRVDSLKKWKYNHTAQSYKSKQVTICWSSNFLKMWFDPEENIKNKECYIVANHTEKHKFTSKVSPHVQNDTDVKNINKYQYSNLDIVVEN